MQYNDQNEYLRRAALIEQLANQHPETMRALSDSERSVLEDYYLAARTAPDATEFRRFLLKQNAKIERVADKAYERLLALAGVSEMLISPQPNGA